MKVPEERMANMLLAVNKTNKAYRWIKWYIDDDRDVIADCDAVIDDSSASQECFEIILRMAHIIDTAYPELMRSMYA